MPPSRKVRLNNHQLLVWARESAGMTVADIARAVDAKEARVEAWERGEDWPTYTQLKDLARKVKRPVAALFLPTPPEPPAPPEDFRHLPASMRGRYGPEALLAFREFRNRLARLAEILAGLEVGTRFTLPRLALDADIAASSGQLRAILGVSLESQIAARSAGAILSAWRDQLFPVGVVVQTLRAPLEEFRGLSVIVGDLAGVGLNTRDPDRARLFSLFHEVAHLCIRRPGVSGEDAGTGGADATSAVEAFCNRFAAEFLLPRGAPQVRDALTELAADPTPDRGRMLSSKLKVSKYVALTRALELGLIDRDMHRDAYVQWRRHDAGVPAKAEGDDGPGYYVSKVAEYGRPYVSTVLSAIERGTLSLHEAARVLDVGLASLEVLRERGVG
jgi:Zn-dependent peptidase ImmA (M78 family)/transcriptional regulator with XRE-family HTH domain